MIPIFPESPPCQCCQKKPQDETTLTEREQAYAFPPEIPAESTATADILLPHQNITAIMPYLHVKIRPHGMLHIVKNTENLPLKPGQKIILESDQGIVMGSVHSLHKDCPTTQHLVTTEQSRQELQEQGLDGQSPGEPLLEHIVRAATQEDLDITAQNAIFSKEARLFCLDCIRSQELDMKLVDVEVYHNRSKLIFYFTAPNRIDFRELVKNLVRNYRTRIELRQIGVRHETQMVGTLGNCGTVCCCRRYLRRFVPVTIRMAKEQNLFLNPAKISGICGRLLCCLSYEQKNYEEFNKNCPKIGKKYLTSLGPVKVLRSNMFSQSIIALTEANEEVEYSLEEWDALKPARTDTPSRSQEREPSPPASRPSKHRQEIQQDVTQAPKATPSDTPKGDVNYATDSAITPKAELKTGNAVGEQLHTHAQQKQPSQRKGTDKTVKKSIFGLRPEPSEPDTKEKTIKQIPPDTTSQNVQDSETHTSQQRDRKRPPHNKKTTL